MAWEDRDYNRSGPPSWQRTWGSFPDILRTLLLGSFPIGIFFAIRVRVHVLFVWLTAIQLLTGGDPLWTLRWITLLFVSVLLHEFGHCFGCRSVGGRANDILMWPLGGLAFCEAPRRPWPEFVTVVCGPLVSLVLAAVPFAALLVWFGGQTPVSLNPFEMWRSGWHGGLIGLLRDVYLVNYTLLLFNLLLVFYPFDGGRLVQIAIWKFTDYYRSMRWATAIGMAGAGGVALFGIINRQLWITLIAVFGFITCYRQNQALASGYGAEPAYDIGLYNQRTDASPGWLGRQREKRKQAAIIKRQQADAARDHEVDRILAKVKAHGLQSLTRKEQKTLQQATNQKNR